jgi:hypothetical protein
MENVHMADFKVLKQVTIPFIVPPENHDPVYVKFLTSFVEDNAMALTRKKRGQGEANQKPPVVAQVVNLETNTRAKLIGNSVVVSTLNESYPKDTYIGKSFQLRRLDKIKSASGNMYHAFEIFEIEVSTETSNAPAKSSTKPTNKK